MNTAPLPSVPVNNFDKIVHAIMFLGLSGVIFFDATGYLRFPVSKTQILLIIFIFPIALGGLIEILQSKITTSRTGDWFDFLFDIVGSLLGLGIALLINHYYLRKKTSTSPVR
jgi:VanZ family protein